MVNEKAIKVAELKSGETGRGIARLDPELMDILGLKVGDIIQIDGTKKTVAKVLRGGPEDANRGTIRIDGSTRRNAGVSLDERVAIKKVVAKNREKEAKAFRICQEKIAQHGLEMKLVEVEYNFEGNKILFFFTAEGRVDFRALVKDLAGVFHTRIELRQIGVRDEAKMLGGLGICGRPFCCSGFLDEFQPVSIKMAKTQNLSLNPTKISGTCGRLMCCLKYEQEAYEDAVKRMPKQESFVETPDGVGTVCQVNLLKEQVKVRLDDSPETPKCYRNCEICVVRSGKGKRPEDYVPPPPEELAKRRYVAPREEGVWERPAPQRTALSEALERVFQAAEESAQPTREKKMTTRFGEREFHGDEVLGIRNVSKSYGDKHLFENISLKVEGGERIALIGDNGTGKSTLIKMIVGELYPDDGRIKTGPQVKEAYLPQIVRFDHPDWNLVENMMAAKRGLSAQSARNRLAAYDFRGEDVFKPVSVLSGGEQSRLRLCMLMDDEINFLILDEPTNHLDIDSREWIEEAVEAYDGTLLFVSHDRYFINRFATRIWELADGTITDYPCGFAQYRQMKAQEEAEKPQETRAVKEKPVTERPQRGNKAQQAAKRQLTICERDIAKAEEAIAALEADMEAAACDYEKLNELVGQKDAAQAELDALYERWEQLSEEAEG